MSLDVLIQVWIHDVLDTEKTLPPRARHRGNDYNIHACIPLKLLTWSCRNPNEFLKSDDNSSFYPKASLFFQSTLIFFPFKSYPMQRLFDFLDCLWWVHIGGTSFSPQHAKPAFRQQHQKTYVLLDS